MHRKASGFTMVELMIVITVLGISLALAIPSYQDIVQKRAATNAAEQVATFLRVARSEAVKRNINISATFDNTATPFCAGIDDSSAACDCRDATACRITQGTTNTDWTLNGNDYENLAAPVLTSNGTATTSLVFTFDPVRGVLDTANDLQGSILVKSSNEKYQLRIDTGRMGRIEICTVSGSPTPVAVGGYQTCS